MEINLDAIVQAALPRNKSPERAFEEYMSHREYKTGLATFEKVLGGVSAAASIYVMTQNLKLGISAFIMGAGLYVHGHWRKKKSEAYFKHLNSLTNTPNPPNPGYLPPSSSQ